jgi:hypothetical protein
MYIEEPEILEESTEELSFAMYFLGERYASRY